MPSRPPYLHWSLGEEYVLVPFIHLDSFSSFFVASLFTAIICLSERFITFAFDINWCPFPSLRRSGWRTALWSSTLYFQLAFLRLSYMMIAMTFHAGLLLVITTTLATGHFMTLLLHDRRSHNHRNGGSYTLMKQPFTHEAHALPTITTRPRSRSKPDDIVIHPTHSNLARADAVALEMGLAGDTERVKGNHAGGDSWEVGKGRDVARALLGGGRHETSRQTFHIADDDDDDSSSSSFDSHR